MNYFLDTEFYERPGRISLISIGLVAEDGREYYAESKDAPYAEIEKDEWLADNVLANLDGGYGLAKGRDANGVVVSSISEFYGEKWRTIPEICGEVTDFTDKDHEPIFYGYYADYDWVVFCWLFGRMVDLPSKFPFYCRDLKQEMDRQGVENIIPQPTGEHNALIDARWNMRLWEALGKP
jgi:hypothetical protein